MRDTTGESASNRQRKKQKWKRIKAPGNTPGQIQRMGCPGKVGGAYILNLVP
jgi:hypothetical protein